MLNYLVWVEGVDQGSFTRGTPGNGVPKVILTVGTAFKPALGELYKSTQFAATVAYLRSKVEKFFWGGGTSPDPLGASILAPSALELGVPSVLFLENDPWCRLSIIKRRRMPSC